MANYRSPGVYVEEISTLPPSIAEVESAVPAFVGYTSIATNLVTNDLANIPTPINSLSDYVQFFGGPEVEDPTHITIDIDEKQSGGKTIGYSAVISPDTAHMSTHILYHAVKFYFANGGTRCYITSVGKYANAIAVADLEAGLDAVKAIDGPTILLCPEAIYLDANPANPTNLGVINQYMASQAASLGDRFAILDTSKPTLPKTSASISADLTANLNDVNDTAAAPYALQYAAVYYPYLETVYNYAFTFDALTIHNYTVNGVVAAAPGTTMLSLKTTASTLYNFILGKFQELHITLPPSAAIAGVYCGIDQKIGVWKAPANISLADVVKADVTVARVDQDAMNVNDQTGKSVNAILNKPGFGTVVMGARTLDGNDNEWRYINVRRFFITVEQSIKNSTGMFVFEPNTSATWVKVQAMIENYLFLKWRDGALAGAKPEQAYFVHIGLGSTMTSVDILEGRLIIQIGMAVARPAEFIIMQFEQMLQTY
jgi:phage tail sheath protein FI